MLREGAVRVGIVADALDDGGGGIATYVRNLVTELRELDPRSDFVLIHYRESADPLYDDLENLVVPIGRGPGAKERRKILRMPFILRRHGFDIVHETTQIGPFFLPGPYRKIVTVHDLVALIHPESLPRSAYWHHRLGLPYVMRTVDRVICDSEATADDLRRLAPASEGKSVVISLASRRHVAEGAMRRGVLARHGLEPDGFLLYVGTLEPRKNIPAMLRAFARARERVTIPKLAVVGKKGWGYEEIFTLVKDLSLEEDVVFTGFVDDDDLPALYDAALAFVYVSRYEGFGLPVLEAMGFGCPVLTSRVSSIPEVAADAALLTDPDDVDAIADSMVRLVTSDDLRLDLARRGRERARRFTWRRTAEETLAVYREVIGEFSG